jgi:hypothetical protein
MLLDKPLVIFFDKADCLSEGTLISFLRQLRDGYNSRPELDGGFLPPHDRWMGG